MALSSFEEPEEAPNPTKKLRWATQRLKGKSGSRKRGSILGRLHHKGSQNEKKRESGGGDSVGTDLENIQEEPVNDTAADAQVAAQVQEPRTIFFNQPLPSEFQDEEGHPRAHYKRNKIRTAKYTAISFVPKNLWFQFHNIANVYFLFLIILAVSFQTSISS